MPNPKVYEIGGKEIEGIELTKGEQLILIKENLRRINEWVKKQKRTKEEG